MTNKYAVGSLGVVLGLLVAVPLFSHAAKEKPSYDYKKIPLVVSQACAEAMAAADDATLATIDSEAKAKKDALLARSEALKVAATISDETKRTEAVNAAKQAYSSTSHITPSAEMKAVMQAQILACMSKEKEKPMQKLKPMPHSRSSSASSHSRGRTR